MKRTANHVPTGARLSTEPWWLAKLLLGQLLGLLMALSTHAELVYDARADFSTTQNPNGAWSYGWMPTDFSRYNAYATTFTTADSHHGWSGFPDGPHVWINQGEPVYGVPHGWLSLHPGVGFQPSVLRWTCPIGGLVSVRGQFLAGHHGLMQVGIRADGQWLWKAFDLGEFDLKLAMLAGQHLDFAVFGSYVAGNTPLDARIELAPTEDGVFLASSNVVAPESASPVVVNISRITSTNSGALVTVNFTTVDGNAKGGEDYAALSGLVAFGPGETNKVILIPLLDDGVVEFEEEFTLQLSSPTGGTLLTTSNLVIRIEDNDFPVEWIDTFESPNHWIPFGDPPPRWLPTFRGRAGIFDNNGDSDYTSGAISEQRFDLSAGYVIESQVYLDFSNLGGCWAGAGFGIVDPQYQDWGGYGARLLLSLDGIGEACWATEPGDRRHAYVGGGYETDDGSEKFQIAADELANRWVTLTIVVSREGFPSFLADGVEVYRGPKPVSTRLRSGLGQLYLGSLSSGSAGKAYHDFISFSQLAPPAGVSLIAEKGWVDPSTNSVRLVALGQGRVYLATDPPMVRVLDWEAGTAPRLRGSWEPLLAVSDLAVAGSTLYVSGWEADFLSTVDRVEVTDPTRPLGRGFRDFPGYANALALDGNLLFLAEDEAGLEILDLGREPFPTVVGHYPTAGAAVAVRAANRRAYLATSQSLLILDVSNPARPVRLGALFLGGEIVGLEVVGETAYVLNRQSGLHLVEVGNPTRPTERSVYRRAASARGLAASGPYVFLAAGGQGLQVLEVPEAGEPRWLVSHGTSSPAEAVAVSGNRVHVAAGQQGLLVLEWVDSRLKLERPANAPNTLRLSWQPDANWTLQRASDLSAPDWQPVPGSQNTNSVTRPVEGGSEFFRLVRP